MLLEDEDIDKLGMDSDSKRAKCGLSSRSVTCRHSCEHHQESELMDPLLWSKLPSEMVEVVFARFSIAKIIELCALSTAWSTLRTFGVA